MLPCAQPISPTLQNLLRLAGSSADEAKTQAKDVLALETRLASASLAPVDQRNPKNMYHFVSVAEADKATPHFSWTKFLATQDVEWGRASHCPSRGFSQHLTVNWPLHL